MIDFIQHVGHRTLKFNACVGRAFCFLLASLWRKPRLRRSFPLLIEQMYFIGVYSLIIIVVSAIFIGMVLALQGYHTLQKFGAEAQLGQFVALSVIRELGPVISALLFAGRAGSSLTAEIGLMQATEQLASMEMMGVDPLWRIISPRFWAGFYVMPLLVAVFDMVSICSSYVMSVDWLGLGPGIFWSNMRASVDFHTDIVNGIIKSFVFGLAVAWIAVYQGYDATPNAQGLSRAATRTVVYASVFVLALDLMLTAVMLGGW